MNNLLWQIQQEQKFASARAASAAASEETSDVRRLVRDVDDRMDRLLLVCQAMWSLLSEATHLTEADLVQRVTDLDLQDGELDGKIVKPIVKCPKCDSAICHKFNRCLWCGEAYSDGSAFSIV